MSDAKLLEKYDDISIEEGDEPRISHERWNRPQSPFRTVARQIFAGPHWVWCIHAAIIFLYVAVFAFVGVKNSDPSRWSVDGKLPYRDAPVHMVSTEIIPGGFHDQFSPDYNEFEGPPTDKNEAAWDRVGNITIVMLDSEEYARFPGETTQARKEAIDSKDKQYVVAPTVFHQLHCINALRKYFWASEAGLPLDEHTYSAMHYDHCLDFLRQSVMCYSDLSPQTYTTTAEGAFYPIFRQEHQCRDFEAVREWIEKRAE